MAAASSKNCHIVFIVFHSVRIGSFLKRRRAIRYTFTKMPYYLRIRFSFMDNQSRNGMFGVPFRHFCSVPLLSLLRGVGGFLVGLLVGRRYYAVGLKLRTIEKSRASRKCRLKFHIE